MTSGIIFKTILGEACLYDFSSKTLSIIDIDSAYNDSLTDSTVDAVTSNIDEPSETLENWTTWFTMEPNESAHSYIANLLKNKNKLKTFTEFVVYTIDKLRSGKKLPEEAWSKDCLKLIPTDKK